MYRNGHLLSFGKLSVIFMAYIAEIGTIKEWEISTSYISKAHGNFVNQIN